ncbi:MAG: PKD domain-containing protein [Bacteroidales bacterium]|nr:PKD domain-containing protein [Bacteroidales bacterium]
MKKIIFIHIFFLNILFSFLYNQLFAQPDSISGLELWLKSDYGVFYDVNNKVTAWNDASGNGYIFSQNNYNLQPLYIYSIDSMNLKPAIKFDNNTLTSTQQITIGTFFILTNFDSNSFYDFHGLITRISVIDTYTDFILVSQSGTNFYNSNLLNGILFINDIQTYDFAPLKTPKIVYSYLESPVIWDDIALGYDRSLWSRFWHGDIYEVIIYDRILNSTEIEQVKTYLMDKYAPPIDLPADTILNSFCPFIIKPNPPAYFTSYQWSTGDTSDSIVVSSPGLYSVSATDIFGRVSSDSIRVYYLSTGLPIDTFICIYDSLNLQSTLSDSLFSFTWSTGDTTPNVTIHSPGEYSLTITDISGCTKIFNISVDEDSFAINSSLGPDTSLCKYDYLSLGSSSSIDSILWSNGSTNNRISVDSSGQYWVYAINNHGCEFRDSVYINIKGERPHIEPHYSTACDGYPVLFSDFSVAVPPDQIANSSWVIGSDTISSQNTNYIFPNAGDHNVYLKVVTDSLCWADTSFTIHVYANPVAEFTPLEGCQHDTIHFTSLSSSIDGAITSYQWTIFDSLYLGTEIYKSFADTGAYELVHYVSTEHGCFDSIVQKIIIKPSPIVDFYFTNSCEKDIIIFNSNIEYPSYYSVINTLWDFGDSTGSSVANPSHIYSSAGSYMVSFSAKLINGCENKIIKILDVYPKPTAGFTYDSACTNKPVTFIDTTTDAISSIWNINNELFYGKNIEYIFTDTGSYEVYLYALNDYGCGDTAWQEVIVHSAPVASMNIDPEYGNPPLEVSFSTNSTGTNYFWDFGDMNSDTSSNVSHIYNSEGIYNVFLVVSNEYTCSDTAYGTVYLLPSILDLQILEINFVDSITLLQPEVVIYNNSTRPVKKIKLDFGFDYPNEFVHLWNNRLEMGEVERIKLPLLLNTDEERTSFCVKATAIDVLDQNDANIDDNILCTSLSNTLYIMKLFKSFDYLNLWINIPNDGQFFCSLINVLGQTMFKSEVIEANRGMNQFKIPILNLTSGIYMLQINYNGNILTRMFDL